MFQLTIEEAEVYSKSQIVTLDNLKSQIATSSWGGRRKIPYALVLGNNERDNNTVTYRKYGEESTTTVSTDEFIDMLNEQVKEYK